MRLCIKGLTEERQRQYVNLIAKISVYLNHLFNSEYLKYDLWAMIPEGLSTTGVQGDNRTYGPFVIISGPPIGKGMTYDVLEEISTKICNTVPVNRVVYQLAGPPIQGKNRKKPPVA